jgi:hypothetical protein
MRTFFIFVLFSILLTACGAAAAPAPTETAQPAIPPTLTSSSAPLSTFTPTVTLEPTETATPTATTTPTRTATATPTGTHTPTLTPEPTYVKLRGKVIIDQAVCHYGPGAPYLYKYGVYKGSNLEIIRRVELGNYIEIQAIGGNNACWVREDYLDIQGDLKDLQPVPADEVKLPMAPYYGPLTGVSARRDGNDVTVFWHPLILRAGDDSGQSPYVLEAWVCQEGQMVFKPVGTYQTAVKVTDEPGCDQPSRGRVTAAEKHGYTRLVEVPWPPFEENVED